MKHLIILLLGIGIILALPAMAMARKVGSFTMAQGTVDLIPAGQEARAAKQGDTVQVGDSVRTRQQGRAEVTFDDGTIVRVSRNSRLEINKFLIGKNTIDAQISLPRGKIQSIVPKKVGQIFGQQETNRFEVKTPVATCGVRGTNFFTYHREGVSGATFQEGQGYFFNNNTPGQPILVGAGQTAIIIGPDGQPELRDATPDELDGGDNGGGTGGGDGGGDTGGGGLGYTPPPPDPTPPAPTPPQVTQPFIQTPKTFRETTPPAGSGTTTPPADEQPSDSITGPEPGLKVAFQLDDEGAYTLLLTPKDGADSFSYSLNGGEEQTRTAEVGITGISWGSHTLDYKAYKDGVLYEATDGPLPFDLHTYNLYGNSSGDELLPDLLMENGFIGAVPGRGWGGWYIHMESNANSPWSLDQGFAVGGDMLAEDIEDSGYWLLAKESGRDTSTLRFLTHQYLGTGTGSPEVFESVFATHDLRDTATGSLTVEQLAFSGQTEGGFLYNDGSGYLADAAYGFGRLGGTANTLFDGTPTSVTMMGGTQAWEDMNQPLLMYGSGFYLNGTTLLGSGTDNNGSFTGYQVGIWRDEKITSRVAAIYIDATGMAGYLIGELSGQYYPNISWQDIYYTYTHLWLLDGDLTATEVGETTIDYSELDWFIENESFDGSSAHSGNRFNTADGGQIVVTYAQGDTSFLQDHDWGVWNAGFVGEYIGATSHDWSVDVVGYYPDDSFYGFWHGRMSGSQWGDAAEPNHDLFATYSGRALNHRYLYEFTGDIMGTYSDIPLETILRWQATGIGTYTRKPLTALARFDGDVFGENYLGDLYWLDGNYGLAGSTDILWSSAEPANAVYMGEYSNTSLNGEGSFVWNNPIESYNVETNTPTTFDGGAFSGYVGGIIDFGAVAGYMVSIYIDPAGNAGFLVGDLSGSTYDHYSGFENYTQIIADGIWTPVQVVSNVGIAPADLDFIFDNSLTATLSGSFASGGGISATQLLTTSDNIVYVNYGEVRWMANQPLGLMRVVLNGHEGYTRPASDTEWSAIVSGSANAFATLNYDAVVSGTWVDGETAGHGAIKADVAGAWVQLSDSAALTGVAGGKLIGTFDPANWQATMLGVAMETSKFVELFATEEGRTKLEQLNIPNVEIGRADLAGTSIDGNLSVNMNNVTFFAFRTGESPSIWASGNVGGTALSDPTGQTANLSGLGGAITANFNMQSWNTANNNWAASVSNGQATQLQLNSTPVDVNIVFQGNAAGQITSPTAFTGTGSGIARPE